MKRDWLVLVSAIALAALLTFVFAYPNPGEAQSSRGCLVPRDQRPDAWALYKSSVFNPNDWAKVAVIHGWADDGDICREIEAFLESTEPGRYLCAPPNGDSDQIRR